MSDALSATHRPLSQAAATRSATSDTGSELLSRPSWPRVAIVPAAGHGTRLRPLTDQLPKELLPLGRLTALEWIVRELAAAGMERVVLVVSPIKEALLRQAFRQTRFGVEIAFAIQPEMRGLGDAILRAAPLLGGETPFLVALGDAVFEEAAPGVVTGRLSAAVCATGGDTIGLAVQEVPLDRVSRYGVVRPTCAGASLPRFEFDQIVEKPTPQAAPSRYAAAARYVLPPAVLPALAATDADAKGEVQLTPALQSLLAAGYRGVAVPLAPGEVRHDVGNFDSYFRAFCAFALSDPELGDSLSQSLADLLARRGRSEAAIPNTAEEPLASVPNKGLRQ